MSSFYKMDPLAWDRGTDDLTLEQEAAFLRVCNAIYAADQPIRANVRVLAGMWRCNERRAKRLLEELVDAGKLSIEDGWIINRRAVEDVSKRRALSVERASAGRRGGIESGKSRAKSAESNGNVEATASTRIRREENRREENRREEKNPPTPQGGSVAVRSAHPEIDAEFDRIWPHYPRHVGVGQARKAWAKARRRAGYDAIAGPLRQFIAATKSTPKDKIPHFATWLNGDRWLDDQSHASNRASTSTEDIARLANVTAADDARRLFAGIPHLRIAQ